MPWTALAGGSSLVALATLGSANPTPAARGAARVIYTVSVENVDVDLLTVGCTQA